MINGWEFPSHVHHGDVGGSEPTQGGPTWQVGQPTYCLHVGPTTLLEDADVGVWARWGPTKCRLADLHFGGLTHHLAPHVVPTCHLQCFVDMWWFWFLIIFASFELDQA